jgi:DNA-binding winged helix-turn-helix (wHTH) protein/tetratricopeptide (TPR) repeat protein
MKDQVLATARAHPLLAFGEFEFDPDGQQLRRDGRPVALNAQPMKVLTYLASHPDEVVTREALQQYVWGNVLVEYDQGINACIRQIRAALNDNADEPRYIRTLRGTGYRFIAPVTRLTPDGAGPAPRPRHRARVAAVAATLAIVVIAVLWVLRPSDPPAAVAETSHNESEALRQQGLAQLRRAHHRPSLDSARHLFNRSTRLSYSSAPALAGWVIALAFTHDATVNDSVAKLAGRLLGRAQALDPQSVETTLASSFVDLFITHDVDSALLRFRRAVDADSTRMFSVLGLGLAWRERGEWSHALDALSRASRLDTASELAATELGDALLHLRRFQDAHAVVSRVSVTPASAPLALLRARLGVVRGNMQAANAALESAAPLTRDSLLRRDPMLARVLGGSSSAEGRPLAALIADTLVKTASSREATRRQLALAEGLLRANRSDEAVDRLAWLLAVPSPVSLELVRRDPLWAAARRTARYAELEKLWSR